MRADEHPLHKEKAYYGRKKSPAENEEAPPVDKHKAVWRPHSRVATLTASLIRDEMCVEIPGHWCLDNRDNSPANLCSENAGLLESRVRAVAWIAVSLLSQCPPTTMLSNANGWPIMGSLPQKSYPTWTIWIFEIPRIPKYTQQLYMY